MGRMMMWRKIGKYVAMARQAVRNRLAYPREILGRVMFLALILFVYDRLWTKVLGERGDFAGFGHAQLIWYLLITEAATFSFPRLQDRVSTDVKTGDIAYRLNRPASYLGQLLAEYLGETLAGAAAISVPGAGLAFLLAGRPPDLSLVHLAPALAALGLGTLVSFGLTASLALTAFWVEDNAPFFWIYSKINFVLGGLFLPVEVYPGFLRTLAEILPFRLIFSAPARLAVRFDPVLLIRTLIAQAVWAAYLLALAWLIYGKGVRKLNVNGG